MISTPGGIFFVGWTLALAEPKNVLGGTEGCPFGWVAAVVNLPNFVW
jgi:hypothetical protein